MWRCVSSRSIGKGAAGNNACTSCQAIKIGRRMEEYDIFWFEEPVPVEDIEGIAAVVKKYRVD
ncbi:MAG: enolase C-terminal domain-like protein [Dehalococcoidales bacterium]